MPTDRRNMPEQELSIKEREQQLFLESSHEQVQEPVRPFAEYLRETPAAPLSVEVKVLLWIAAVVTGILFAAAVWKASRSSTAHTKPRPARPAAEDSTQVAPGLPTRAWIAARKTNARTTPARLARRHRGLSRLGGGSICAVLQVPNSGRRIES